MSSWRRTYWSVWIANLVTSIGMMSFLPFFPSLLEEMGVADETAKRAWAGAIFGAAPLSATVMSPIWGAIGDRVGRKLMVCRAMLAITVFVGGMYFVHTPWGLLLLRLGQGLFSGFIPPSITLVSIAAPPARQGRVAGDLTTALALGAILGPALGGWMASWTGEHRTVFLIVGACSLVSAGLVAGLAQEDPSQRLSRAPDPADAPRRTVRAALRDIRRDIVTVIANPVLRGAAGVVFALQFSLGSINPVLELHARELVAGTGMDTDLATSLLFSAMGVCNLLALPFWGRYGDRVGHRRALVLCAGGCVLALGLQAAATVYAFLLVGRLAMGVAMAGTGPLAFGLAAGEISAQRRGGAFGVVFSARTLAVAVGGISGGALSAVIGVRGLMLASGLLLLSAVLAFRRQPASSASTP